MTLPEEVGVASVTIRGLGSTDLCDMVNVTVGSGAHGVIGLGIGRVNPVLLGSNGDCGRERPAIRTSERWETGLRWMSELAVDGNGEGIPGIASQFCRKHQLRK